MMIDLELDNFTSAFITASLWATTDDKDKPLDEVYDAWDFSKEALEKIKADCKKFQEENGALITEDNYEGEGLGGYYIEEIAGHDFFLTRNGHGAGFWDGDWEDETGKKLTAAAKAFGDMEPYIGDDGKLYV